MTREKHLALGIVAILAECFGPGSKIAKELPGWIEYLTDVECPERPRTHPGAAWWGRVRGLLDRLCNEVDWGDSTVVWANATRIGQHFGLTEIEARILKFFAAYRIFDMFERVVDQALETREVTLPFLIGQFSGAEQGEVRAALRPDARLKASGLLQNEGRNWASQRVPYAVGPRLANVMLADVNDIEDLVALLFPSAPAPDADWQDFEELGKSADLMRKLLGSGPIDLPAAG